MSRSLYRLGHFCVRRRRLVAGAWLAVLVGIGVAASVAGGTTTNRLQIPGTESQRATDQLARRFPARSGSTAWVVFAAPPGANLTASADRAAIVADLAHAAGLPEVGAFQPAASIVASPSGNVAYAQVPYTAQAQAVPKQAVRLLEAPVRAHAPAGVKVSFGGDVIAAAQTNPPGHSSEVIGLGASKGIRTLLNTHQQTYMREFGARPHWGLDLDTITNESQLRALDPRYDAWKAIYLRFNAGTFDGKVTDRLGISVRPR